ncbi:DUF1054 domain-containing protein [Enterococcus sp. BWM-S5]|uniref:UPF0637 protein I6N96_16345 n=1 Tax=Enterococcus larvae TaxID=2794352 RepID=A0ABS4CNL2_9ENTE|nr:DUF1054 domain-containing protein [Enterococcus larvae]MBP1047862.1 DUF1054 domain-containing protein [Enterococcus larvae]
MFTEKSFEVFEIDGLEPRMEEIRSLIQPVFQELDEYFALELGEAINKELFVHIAQHRRRTAYPPENTWSALSQKKRGYKMEPHFQLGIWPEYIFMWLSLIDNPKNEQKIAEAFLNNQELLDLLPEDFYMSLDHTQPEIEKLNEADVERGLLRFCNIKKGEFQVGRIIRKDSQLLEDPEKAKAYMLDTYQQLLPLYTLAMEQG